MRPRSAAILACRVIALFFGIEAILAVVSFVAFNPGFERSGAIWATIGTAVVIAFFLWVGAETFSVIMSRGAPDEAPSKTRSLANAHAVVFSVVGIVQITEAIPALIAAAAASPDGFGGAFGVPGLGGGGGFGFGRNSAIAAGIVRLVIGLVLIAASGDLARMLAPRYPEPESPQEPPEPS